MLTAFIRFGDGKISTQTDHQTLTAAFQDPQSAFWLDMNCPSNEELALLANLFGFHPLAIEDTIGHPQRPKIESYCHIGDSRKQGYCYMVIHGPDLQAFKQKVRTKEIDIFVSDRYLLTIHDEPHLSISDEIKRASADPHLVLDAGIDMLLYAILDRLVDNYNPILDHIQEDIDVLEEQAVTDPTPDLLPQKIARQKRELLNLRRVIGPQREVMAQLTRGEVPFIRETTRVYLRDILDHLVRAVETIELYRDLVVGTRDIYLSSISNNLNRIMKTLTIITVITLPLNVITGFFGMNFEYIPGIHSPIAFWICVGLMVTAVTTMLVLFKRKSWL